MEKREFFSLLTKRQKHSLGNALGIERGKIPDRENLKEYFKDHQLPDDSWRYWAESKSLNDARVLTAEAEGVTPTEMGIYPRSEIEAGMRNENIPIPVVFGHVDGIKQTLHTLLSGAGVQNISVDLSMMSTDEESSSDVRVLIDQDRSSEVMSAL